VSTAVRRTDLELDATGEGGELLVEAVEEAGDQGGPAGDDDVGEKGGVEVWVDLDERVGEEAGEGLQGVVGVRGNG
jgi:hypothetical protein